MVNISKEKAGQKCTLYKRFFCPNYGEHLTRWDLCYVFDKVDCYIHFLTQRGRLGVLGI